MTFLMIRSTLHDVNPVAETRGCKSAIFTSNGPRESKDSSDPPCSDCAEIQQTLTEMIVHRLHFYSADWRRIISSLFGLRPSLERIEQFCSEDGPYPCREANSI
jgi:hypothetical protein